MTQPAFGQVAPISRRAVAYLIDALIAGGLAIVLGGGLLLAASLTGSLEGMLAILMIGGPIVSLILIAWFFVYTMMQSKNGSIGMRAQGLRLQSAVDGGPLGFGRTLLRNIIFGLAASIVVGYFTPLFDGSGRFQGWHDKVAKSLMVDARTAGEARTDAPPPHAQAPTPPPSHAAPIPGIPAPAPSGGSPTFAPPAAPRVAPSPAPAAPAAGAAAAQSAPAAAPRPVVPAAPIADAGSLIAYVPGVTQDAPPLRAEPVPPAPASPAGVPQAPPVAPPSPFPAPAAPPAPPAAAPQAAAPQAAPATLAPVASPTAMDPDDAELEDTRISIPGHRLVFTWDDGTRVSVSRRTIFGRNPAPEEGATVVPVRDETLSLSKTHFEAAAETSGGWVLDRHSTNGMTIVREGQRIACPPGQRVPVRLGDAIEIGDRIVTVGGYA